MKALHGIDGVLFFKKNEVWVVYGCCENVDVNLTTEYKSVKTIGDGQWDTPRAQKHGYTLSCSGIVQYDDEDNRVNHFDLIEYQVSGVHIEWFISFKENDKVTEHTQLRGFALVVNSTISAPNDFVNSSLELKGKGELLRGAPPTCTAEIDDYTVTQDDLSYALYHVAIIELVSGSVPQYHYRIDGGAIETALSTGWTFNVAGLPGAGLGAHVLEIWPVCDNGIDGVLTTHPFTTSLL